MNERVERLAEILKESSNIVFFGGAGVSTASGIPDFRSADGLFSQKLQKKLSPEQLVSHSFYLRYPKEFFDFYKKHLLYPSAKPNECHLALARLEAMGKLKGIVTQNIDGLHQAAGSKVVEELHGSVLRNYCTSCHAFYDMNYILESEGVPHCNHCGGDVKPDVVLYEEGLDQRILKESVSLISQADVLIIGGTSMVVYPAAGLIHYFKGRHLVVINKSQTMADEQADLVICDNIDRVIGEAVTFLEQEESGK